METNKQNSIIDRCIEIEQVYDNIQPITINSENIEDCDDLYQAKLELQWYKTELEEEYELLNKELGFNKRKLYPKASRRLI